LNPDALPRLELENVLRADGAEIIAAREKARLIHRTRDIDAGDEVEESVRKVIRRKLPTSYYIGHGHVVDSSLTSSPQMDVVIADNSGSPILFMTENGTEYFPYEAVYAVGEIKSTYYRREDYVRKFVKSVAHVRTDLKREPTPPTYLGSGLNVGRGITTGVTIPYQNPLFSFMVFANAGDFHESDLDELYTSEGAGVLPNIVCLLGKGVVVNVKAATSPSSRPMSININPEFNRAPDAGVDWFNTWVFVPADLATSFGILYFALVTHLRGCRLMPPNMLDYLNNIFRTSVSSGRIIGIDITGAS
jgi:hypothetical protein